MQRHVVPRRAGEKKGFLTRYGRLYRLFARNNLVRELEFRGNFWGKVVTNIAWLFSFVLFLKILFANTHALAGWSEGEAFVLFGTFMVSRALMDILFTQNLGKIPEMVRLGTMDFVLTKPVPSQFFVSTRFISLDELGSFFGAIAVIAYGAHLSRLSVSAAQVGAWLVLTLCGLLILYALQMGLMTLSFWLVKLDNLSALVDTVVFVARYPTAIFPKVLALALTYVLPLAFVAYVPTLALRDGVSVAYLGTALLVTSVFVWCAGAFWAYATRVYTSASS